MKKHHYYKLNHCIICNKIITDYYKLCKSCSHKKPKKKCKDCGKELSARHAVRCHSCTMKFLWKKGCFKKRLKGKLSPNWKGGLPHCIYCGKKLSGYDNVRCKKCQSIIMKKTRLGKNNPAYKKGIYIRNKKCTDCGKHCSSGAMRCKSCSEHFNKLGKKNPQYIHGKGHLPYTKDFPKIRLTILKRDKQKCKLCTKEGNYVHHIDYNKLNNHKNNLITLCAKCHTKTNCNRDYWYEYFRYIMNDKFKS